MQLKYTQKKSKIEKDKKNRANTGIARSAFQL